MRTHGMRVFCSIITCLALIACGRDSRAKAITGLHAYEERIATLVREQRKKTFFNEFISGIDAGIRLRLKKLHSSDFTYPTIVIDSLRKKGAFYRMIFSRENGDSVASFLSVNENYAVTYNVKSYEGVMLATVNYGEPTMKAYSVEFLFLYQEEAWHLLTVNLRPELMLAQKEKTNE